MLHFAKRMMSFTLNDKLKRREKQLHGDRNRSWEYVYLCVHQLKRPLELCIEAGALNLGNPRQDR